MAVQTACFLLNATADDNGWSGISRQQAQRHVVGVLFIQTARLMMMMMMLMMTVMIMSHDAITFSFMYYVFFIFRPDVTVLVDWA